MPNEINTLTAQNKATTPTVPELLRVVDYKSLVHYKPSEFAINYLNFVKMVNAGMEDIQTSPNLHYKMVDLLTEKHSHIANLLFRGSGKTVVMAEMLVLYLAVFRTLPNFGTVDVMMYIADSMENGAKSLRQNIEARWNNSKFLQKYIPVVKFTDSEIILENIEGKKLWCKLFGIKTGVRGFKRGGNRPQVAILDDVLTDEDANSALTIDKVKDVIYAGIDNAMNPRHKKVIYNGTPFNKNDPLYEAIESGQWRANVFPVCDTFPCEREDFVGAWEERFSYDFVMRQYQLAVSVNRGKNFKQELMLQIAADEDRVIADSDLRWFKSQDVIDKLKGYNVYITTDFATSINRKADYTVIGVWAIDKDNNRYLIDGVLGRQLMHKTFEDIFMYVRKYKPMSVGIEATGQQGGFISLLRSEMVKRNIFFTVAKGVGTNKEGIATKTNKMDRFRLTEPFFKNGKIWLPEDLKNTTLIQELLDELSLVTIDGIKSVHDDALDMVSQLNQIQTIVPDNIQAGINGNKSQAGNAFYSAYNDPYFTELLPENLENTDTYGYGSYLV